MLITIDVVVVADVEVPVSVTKTMLLGVACCRPTALEEIVQECAYV